MSSIAKNVIKIKGLTTAVNGAFVVSNASDKCVRVDGLISCIPDRHRFALAFEVLQLRGLAYFDEASNGS
jgi:hypothetical protein